MQLSHSRKLVGADCVAPCRMAFPPQELLWLFRLESIDIWLFLRDYRKGLLATATTATFPGLPLERNRSKHSLHSALHRRDAMAAI